MKNLFKILSVLAMTGCVMILCNCSGKSADKLKPRILETLKEHYVTNGEILDIINIKQLNDDMFTAAVQWKAKDTEKIEFFAVKIVFLGNETISITSLDDSFELIRSR